MGVHLVWSVPLQGKYLFSSTAMKFIDTVMWAEHGTSTIPSPALLIGSSVLDQAYPHVVLGLTFC